ncbi:class I SAM-dependent methyltransferase [Ectothiorhodospira lacustris]|uniref:class I SAM-dependent methyltransferase n=1 Tax=Ectothiorhodospira lacustris TaxID=2899127 RepID=UPI001EE83FE5|nr:class I SAM-dependent methyltransferase [Ectothiorhodospira lacustris]MCG5499371.1 class I SAM-dependent methyltransferase [Ectothiorhodospira lacustris]MCG5509260.1 class I SAM-dependent methyltransferase [Ectothiorhodospira lacustris]MCG5521050.1 class I SAM-dependent methyltransferase [Ectothiorhodospira lacustris]
MTLNRCPLCHGLETPVFHREDRPRVYYRDYHRCLRCDLTFVPSRYHLSTTEEKAYYDLHENQSADEGYQQFLGRMLAPLLERVRPGAVGLDFGCGAGQVLVGMCRRAGLSCVGYDLHYYPDPAPLEHRYDFIISTEVFEHLADPAGVLEQLLILLKPGGWLGIMTKRALDRRRFARWHYTLDPTHVCFFSEQTFRWIAARTGTTLAVAGNDVVMFGKPGG